MQRYLVGLMLCILPLLGVAQTASTEALVMPRELVDVAHANSCEPINDFFERPGMVDPPYVLGWLPGNKEDSAVFWCKKKDGGEKPYKLMFMPADPKQLGGCPAIIESRNRPRGLSIETRSRLALNTFRYLAKPQRTGPATVVPKAKVLVNTYDGVGEDYYCHKGQWLVYDYD